MESLVSITTSRWKVDFGSLGPHVPSCRLGLGTTTLVPRVPSCKPTLSVLHDRHDKWNFDLVKGHNSGLVQHSLNSWRSKWWPPQEETLTRNLSRAFSIVLAVVGKRRLILWRHHHHKAADIRSGKLNKETAAIFPIIEKLVSQDDLWTPKFCFLSTDSTELWNFMQQKKLWKCTLERPNMVKEENLDKKDRPSSVQEVLDNKFKGAPSGFSEVVTAMIMVTTKRATESKWNFEETVFELLDERFCGSKGEDFFAALESDNGSSWVQDPKLDRRDKWRKIYPARYD